MLIKQPFTVANAAALMQKAAKKCECYFVIYFIVIQAIKIASLFLYVLFPRNIGKNRAF